MSKAMLLAISLGLLGACGSEDRQAPSTADFVIEKSPESGDKQVGVAGEPLPGDLRARVTRDGRPVEGVTVYWTTMQGTMDPPEAVTDAQGSAHRGGPHRAGIWSRRPLPASTR